MSYQLRDANDYVGDLASGKGLQELTSYIVGRSSEYPELAGLCVQGSALITDGLMDEAKTAMDVAKSASLKSTLTNLYAMLGKCEIVAVINDGMEEE